MIAIHIWAAAVLCIMLYGIFNGGLHTYMKQWHTNSDATLVRRTQRNTQTDDIINGSQSAHYSKNDQASEILAALDQVHHKLGLIEDLMNDIVEANLSKVAHEGISEKSYDS